MVAVFQLLRSGAWVEPGRVRAAALAMIAMTLAAIAYTMATRSGTVDAWHRPVGTDFSNVWTAGRMALEGRAAAAWDWPSHYAAQQAAHHDAAIPFYGWHYPPFFLLVASALALLPYLWALCFWQATTLGAAALVVRRIVPGRDAMVAALGFPAVFICLGHGQNGFLTAALLGSAILTLDRRPWIAGILIGLVAYKPQLGMILPLFLIAGRHWRAFAGASVTVVAMTLATLVIWGPGVWQAFADSLALTRHVVGEDAQTGAHKMVSAFAAVRLNGGTVAMAYAAQGIAALAAVAAAMRFARARRDLAGAILLTGSLLATPYAFDYDLPTLGIAIALLVRDRRAHGDRPWEASLLALAWASPILTRPLTAATGIPLGLIAIAALWAVAITRAQAARRAEEEPVSASRMDECPGPAGCSPT